MPTININDIPESKVVKLVDLSDDSINKIAEAIVRKIVNAEPVKHGHWLKNGNRYCECSICHAEGNMSGNDYYCRNCGAKMDKKILCETCAYLDVDKDGNKVCWVESDVDYIFFVNDHDVTYCDSYEKVVEENDLLTLMRWKHETD